MSNQTNLVLIKYNNKQTYKCHFIYGSFADLNIRSTSIFNTYRVVNCKPADDSRMVTAQLKQDEQTLEQYSYDSRDAQEVRAPTLDHHSPISADLFGMGCGPWWNVAAVRWVLGQGFCMLAPNRFI